MSYWHYQLGFTTDPDGERFYGIYEIYKDSRGCVEKITENPISIAGESKDEIIDIMKLMVKDIHKHGVFNKDLMEYEDFNELDDYYEDEDDFEDEDLIQDLTEIFR